MIERYLREIDCEILLRELGVADQGSLLKSIKHFSEKEAEERDAIVQGYFGATGIEAIASNVAESLQSLHENSTILDVGAGTGFFTVRVAEKLSDLNPSFYALDVTPAMLLVLVGKLREMEGMPITVFLGVAEKIAESVELCNRAYRPFGIKIPTQFDAIISVLTLHHCERVKAVFNSIRRGLRDGGRLVLVDLCEHPFEEFKEEMGDIHLGFNPEEIRLTLSDMFEVEEVEKMPGIRCEESGRAAELFIAVAIKSRSAGDGI